MFLFSLFLSFLNYKLFFKTIRDLLFLSYVQRLFSVDGHRNPPEFDHDRTELADMDNSECKANFILKTWTARGSWFLAFPWKILLFSEIKRRKLRRCTWEAHLIKKRETQCPILIFIWLFYVTRVPRLLLHTFSSSVKLTKENYSFRSWNWIVDCPVNLRRLQNFFNDMFSAHTIFSCFCSFNTDGKTSVLPSVTWGLWHVTSLSVSKSLPFAVRGSKSSLLPLEVNPGTAG